MRIFLFPDNLDPPRVPKSVKKESPNGESGRAAGMGVLSCSVCERFVWEMGK